MRSSMAGYLGATREKRIFASEAATLIVRIYGTKPKSPA